MGHSTSLRVNSAAPHMHFAKKVDLCSARTELVHDFGTKYKIDAHAQTPYLPKYFRSAVPPHIFGFPWMCSTTLQVTSRATRKKVSTSWSMNEDTLLVQNPELAIFSPGC